MFIAIFIISVILVGLALVGLGIGMLVKKNGKFPETHIGKNKNMKKRGIKCAKTTDREDREKYHPIDIDKEEK